jgi:nitroreductase
MDARELFKHRHSTRHFKPDPVPPQDIEEILTAARLAPTARNIQPWDFVVVKDPEIRKQLAALAVQNAPFLAQAPVCMAIFCQDTKYYLEDGCAATTQALLAAAALGLGACWVAGDKKDYALRVAQVLNAPSDRKLVSLIAIGWPQSTEKTPKKDPKDIVHQEKFRHG